MKRGELNRNKAKGKIGGVCAGIAEYFGIETWLVRILTVTAFLLAAGPFVLVAYVAAWFILDDKASSNKTDDLGHKGYVPQDHADTKSGHYSGKGFRNEHVHSHEKVAVKSKVWQAGVPPRKALLDIKQRYATTEDQLRRLESYVTSKEFQLNREINRL
ncbi:envelope stress response membrane protein PspC [Glaciecola sp. 2405UD65-10]|jgi:phage shock protein C|uniref:envelope stress response membrane protein PspC n=1 Tax=Glaciecola sp. 2405UD65-10 TaxID=3397244 RepID=UPI003B5CF75F